MAFRLRSARIASRAALVCALLGAFAGQQALAGAPIEYRAAIARTQPALYAPPAAPAAAPIAYRAPIARVPGDYGYGAAAPAGAPIDLRARFNAAPAAPPPQPEPVVEPATPLPLQPAEEAPPPRPDWLETERAGAPYEAKGKWYVPTPEPGYSETGTIALYPEGFAGRETASGEPFDPQALSAAHPTLPLPSLIQVTNAANGREMIVRVTDRGPFAPNALLALSPAAAQALDLAAGDQAHVRYLGPAPKRVQAPSAPVKPRLAQAAPAQSIPAKLEAPSARGDFVVQVGAFASDAKAQAVRAKAQAAGPAFVDSRVSGDKTLFRVRVGPWPTRDQAEAARTELASLGFGEAVLTSAR